MAPRFLQVQVPPAYSPNEHPLVRYDPDSEYTVDFAPGVDADKLTSEERRQAELSIRSFARTAVYQRFILRVDPLLFEGLWGEKDTYTTRFAASPLGIITRGDVESMRDLRAAFDCTRLYWDLLVGKDKGGDPLVPHPLGPIDRDFDSLKDLLDSGPADPLEVICGDVLESFGLSREVDSCIEVDKFDAVEAALVDTKQKALEFALTQETKALLEETWPIKDGNLSLSAQVCY